MPQILSDMPHRRWCRRGPQVRKVLEMVDEVIWNGLDQDEMEAFCGTMEKICRNLEECDFKFDEQET